MLSFTKKEKCVSIHLKQKTNSYSRELCDVYRKALLASPMEILKTNESSKSQDVSYYTLETMSSENPLAFFGGEATFVPLSRLLKEMEKMSFQSASFHSLDLYSIIFATQALQGKKAILNFVVGDFVEDILNSEKNCSLVRGEITTDFIDPNVKRRNEMKIRAYSFIKLCEWLDFLGSSCEVNLFSSEEKMLECKSDIFLSFDGVLALPTLITKDGGSLLIISPYKLSILKNKRDYRLYTKYQVYTTILTKLKNELEREELVCDLDSTEIVKNQKIYTKTGHEFSDEGIKFVFRSEDYEIIKASIKSAQDILLKEFAFEREVLFEEPGTYSKIFSYITSLFWW